MKSAYLVGGIVFVICIAIAIYYLTPGIDHVLTFSASTASHKKHAIVFFGLGVVALIAARFAANSRAAR